MEAKKMGFEQCIVPKSCMEAVSEIEEIKVIGVSNIREAIDLI
jgi:DNA repair protein RadA/Sms